MRLRTTICLWASLLFYGIFEVVNGYFHCIVLTFPPECVMLGMIAFWAMVMIFNSCHLKFYRTRDYWTLTAVNHWPQRDALAVAQTIERLGHKHYSENAISQSIRRLKFKELLDESFDLCTHEQKIRITKKGCKKLQYLSQ